MIPDLTVSRIGDCTIPSPMKGIRFIRDDESVLYHSDLREIRPYLDAGEDPPAFERAGPRERIHFDPEGLRCGIVTCGGLCPGLNDVIRAIVLSLSEHYGVRKVYGFRYGYEGLSARHGLPPIELTPETVAEIHNAGGTILGSSRGPQDVGEMVDTLERLGVGILFSLGGDGTLRGTLDIAEEAARRGRDISVIGVPKTIDNDIAFVQTSFGFDTAVSESRQAIYSATREAMGARNGIGMVKLMGRHSGFIAAYAALANAHVDFCLVPEVPFTLDGFLAALRAKIEEQAHAVVLVAEGAGQDLVAAEREKDASGNVHLADIGLFLSEKIRTGCAEAGLHVTLKYIDPSYSIRSMPANARDSAFCLLLGHNAVHAGMAGRTGAVVGFWRNRFTQVPITAAVSERKVIRPESRLWSAVVAATGQPTEM